jgi:DNA mismatch repair protein MSH2
VLTSFAAVAALAPNTYCRPVLHPLGSGTDDSNERPSRVLSLRKARHPCVELMDYMDFIANDYNLCDGSSSFQIITGPNMGGKSTYIRGLGSIVLLAQVGCFVPCEEAEIAVVDAILARVGAGDAGQKGVSTFMAEMLEAAVLVETATPNSLVIIDELGRGTSTVDGFGLAWGIAQYLASRIQPFCLFATHFYELTALEKQVKHVVNKHVSAYTGEDNEIVMLHNIADGPCSESFGIHVAAMAGFPPSVITEAKRKAAELELQGDCAVPGEYYLYTYCFIFVG